MFQVYLLKLIINFCIPCNRDKPFQTEPSFLLDIVEHVMFLKMLLYLLSGINRNFYWGGDIYIYIYPKNEIIFVKKKNI